ncbi:MAG TPA: Flp family type IVb pilin [Candidatus Binataceae bacterium]|nr:Flp family type IVb pilin [Candidatus Binataceae bacterium]
MNVLAKKYIKVSEGLRKLSRGQTMTEYALIMAAIAVVVFAVYQTMGQDIETLVNSVNSSLTAAAS